MLCIEMQVELFDRGKGEEGKSIRLSVSSRRRRETWIKAIPRPNLTENNNTRVCRYHWPADCAAFILSRGKKRPTEPPSVFDDIPASCLSLPPPKPRKTILASCSNRNIIPDELERYRETDKLLFTDS